jgi:hypothetical protein
MVEEGCSWMDAKWVVVVCLREPRGEDLLGEKSGDEGSRTKYSNNSRRGRRSATGAGGRTAGGLGYLQDGLLVLFLRLLVPSFFFDTVELEQTGR